LKASSVLLFGFVSGCTRSAIRLKWAEACFLVVFAAIVTTSELLHQFFGFTNLVELSDKDIAMNYLYAATTTLRHPGRGQKSSI